MKLRGIDFGPIWGASGAQGFFGEGYPYHRYWRLVPGFNFEGMTFVAKTTTLLPREGNMPLRADNLTPQEFKPKCIVVKPFKGVALNAVGLSGPGAEWLFNTGRWQSRRKPFFISFMSLAQTATEKQKELEEFVLMAKVKMKTAKTKWGLQINFSCPNVGLTWDDEAEFISEVEETLNLAAELDVPLVPKFNILLSPRVAQKISLHPACDAIHVSNTIPFGKEEEKIAWQRLFGDKSPLSKLGGGGLSGRAIFPLVADWLHEALVAGVACKLNMGGGIFNRENVKRLMYYGGAYGVSIGTVAMLRPWRVQGIIKEAHNLRRE